MKFMKTFLLTFLLLISAKVSCSDEIKYIYAGFGVESLEPVTPLNISLNRESVLNEVDSGYISDLIKDLSIDSCHDILYNTIK